MIEIPILDTKGQKIGSEKLDPAILGDRVRAKLLKLAVVSYRANQRQGTLATKSRADVHGASRKLYKQKGTGRARAGNLRTPVRRGGGHAFAKKPVDFSQPLPRGMRRLARNSAILAKAQGGAAMIVKGFSFTEPKTSAMAKILKAVAVPRGALLAVTMEEPNMWRSCRNIPETWMKLVWELNAYDVLRARRLIFTPEAFKAFVANPELAGKPAAIA